MCKASRRGPKNLHCVLKCLSSWSQIADCIHASSVWKEEDTSLRGNMFSSHILRFLIRPAIYFLSVMFHSWAVLILVSGFESRYLLKLLIHSLSSSTNTYPVPAVRIPVHGLPWDWCSSVSALTEFKVSQGRKILRTCCSFHVMRVAMWREEVSQEHVTRRLSPSPEKVSWERNIWSET